MLPSPLGVLNTQKANHPSTSNGLESFLVFYNFFITLTIMKEKLLKIKVLAERGGTEGEKASAKHLLDKLCKKHGIKAENLEEEIYVTSNVVSYSDGIKVCFAVGVSIYDHQFSNGAIVRYFRDGSREVLRKAVQQIQTIRIVDGFGNGWNSSTVTGGSFSW